MRSSIAYICLLLIVGNAFSQTKPADKIYKIWDDQPAPNRGGDYNIQKAGGFPYDADWELESYPIGNGYMGANFFGRTDTERIQITEKTLLNRGLYGLGSLTNFAEIYLDFNHKNPKNYSRTLNINEAVATIKYMYEGVNYTREYFMSYPDNVLIIKLEADKKGKISFKLRPEIPYLVDSVEYNKRSGKIVAENDLITLAGTVNYFSTNYEAQIKVINEGGKLLAENAGDKGSINISNANSLVVIIATGTNYVLSEDLFKKRLKDKLDLSVTPHKKVSEIIQKATEKGYEKLRENHLADYQNLFSRVSLDLNSKVPELTTKSLLENYKNGDGNLYLEELMFQYGRYLLIASSRKGALPSGLQGVWSQYQVTPWTGGYWHNINIQMNYWGAFNTNLAETFTPYIEYFGAYEPAAAQLATQYLQRNNPEAISNENNGWTIGTGANPYEIQPPGGHSGPGTGGFTSKLFWEYYDFTRDTTFLRESGYPALLGMSKFLSKTVKPSENGTLLVEPSASPEQRHEGSYYNTKGTTFDQGFVWENHNDLLKAAAILNKKDDFLKVVKDQVNKLDPILIGQSGQIKEYREEIFYSDIGDKQHRHISHLCALYPGTLINSTTKEWLNASIVTLDLRGNNTTGWAMAHRMNLRARTKDGEKAHEVYTKFIKERTLPNLWTTHPPFQIDGSFGCMAGVAEMLLQSHEGSIEPLAALPEAWNNGEYKGLVARGNFEISAVWKNGQATSFEIISKSGGRCKMMYPGIGNVQVKNDSGEIIPFNKESTDLINFKTKKEGRYFIDL
ncbi:glycoside hydrolase family 95 protein [Draconibacterium sp.]|nr:glycoside hydrolase family 95 protein [Draconibacterium sp.]